MFDCVCVCVCVYLVRSAVAVAVPVPDVSGNLSDGTGALSVGMLSQQCGDFPWGFHYFRSGICMHMVLFVSMVDGYSNCFGLLKL